MNRVHLYSALILLLLSSCKNLSNNRTELGLVELGTRNEHQLINDIIDLNLTIDSLHYIGALLKVSFRDNGISYVSDIIAEKDISLVIYGNIHNPNVRKDHLYTYIDSLKLIEPIDTTLKFKDPDARSGYLYRSEAYSFDEVLKIDDFNNDGQNDFEINCGICSGSNGAIVYTQFILNKENHSILKKSRY
jgi:hypothetical protein